MPTASLKPKAFAVAVSLILLAGGLTVVSIKPLAADDKKANAPRPALTVTLTQPLPSQLPVKLSANGNIAAWQEASIGSEAAGLRLVDVRVGVGDVVKAGQVLAVFSATSVQADMAQARATLAEAQANAMDAAGNAERARTLKTTGALSDQQINQFLTGEQTAKARVEAAKAGLDVQQERLNQTRVLAPDSGIISARTATVGAVVGNGTELFRLIRKGRIEWRAEVTAAELGRITTGVPVRVTAVSGQQVAGRVRMIAPTVNQETRAALVYVDLPPMGAGAAGQFSIGVGAILPGMFAKGEFDLGKSHALTVPQMSVVVRDGFSYIYKLGADSRVARTKVQTGRAVGDRIEIVSGLEAGSRVVAMGAGFLNEGDLVKVVDGIKPAAPDNAPANAAVSK